LLEMTAACWGISHFHVYLYGRPFRLLTDHRPLETMTHLHQKTMNRLQQMLNEYNFVIEYRKGENNEGPDALSRNPVDELEVSCHDFRKLQSEDNFISDMLCFKEQGLLPDNKAQALTIKLHEKNMFKENDLIYYILVKKGFVPRQLLVIPSVLQQEFIHGAHATRFSGHGGVMKTVLRLQERYFWPGMTTQVEEYIKRCMTCAKCKTKVPKSPLQPIELPELPNQRCHMDLVGPLKTSAGGNKFVLAITDAFTKYAVVVAIPDKSAVTVAKAVYIHWICKFTAPKVLVSDRGKEFCNIIMDELCMLMGVERRMTTVMHPQSNTAVESWNRSLVKYMTTALTGGSTLDWEEHLPALAICYNTAVHKSTLHSPFYLTFLHHPNLPYFNMESTAPMYSPSWPTEAFLRMRSAYKLARENNMEALQKGKEYYDRSSNVKVRTFNIGDRVLVNYPKSMSPGNKKFSEEWRDGFIVVKVTGPASYIVQRGPHGRPTSVPVVRLAPDPSDPSGGVGKPPAQQRQRSSRLVTPPPPPDDDGVVWMEVDPPAPVLPPVPVHAPAPPNHPPALVLPGPVNRHAQQQPPVLQPELVEIPEQAPPHQQPLQEVPPLGRLDRMAQDLFQPRQTRSRGPVADLPLVKDSDFSRKNKKQE